MARTAVFVVGAAAVACTLLAVMCDCATLQVLKRWEAASSYNGGAEGAEWGEEQLYMPESFRAVTIHDKAKNGQSWAAFGWSRATLI